MAKKYGNCRMYWIPKSGSISFLIFLISMSLNCFASTINKNTKMSDLNGDNVVILKIDKKSIALF